MLSFETTHIPHKHNQKQNNKTKKKKLGVNTLSMTERFLMDHSVNYYKTKSVIH